MAFKPYLARWLDTKQLESLLDVRDHSPTSFDGATRSSRCFLSQKNFPLSSYAREHRQCAPKPLPAERAPASENVGASSFMKSSDVDFFRLIGWKVV
jgi:hypothetical protein